MKKTLEVLVAVLVCGLFLPGIIAATLLAVLCMAVIKLLYTGAMYLIGLFGRVKKDDTKHTIKGIDDVYHEMFKAFDEAIFE